MDAQGIRKGDEEPKYVNINGVTFVVEYENPRRLDERGRAARVRVRPIQPSKQTSETLDYENGPVGVLPERGNVAVIATGSDPDGVNDHVLKMARKVMQLLEEYYNPMPSRSTHGFHVENKESHRHSIADQECYIYSDTMSARTVQFDVKNYLEQVLAKYPSDFWSSQPPGCDTALEENEAVSEEVRSHSKPLPKRPKPSDDVMELLEFIAGVLAEKFPDSTHDKARAKATGEIVTGVLQRQGRLPASSPERGVGFLSL